MSSTTTGPYQYITSTGVIVADTDDLQTEVQSEWQADFGADVNIDDETANGVIINAETLGRSAVVKNNAALGNQINPNQSGGQFLDAICALTSLERAEDTYSTYSGVILAGQPGVPIPIGTSGTINGNTFLTIAAVELDPITGQATVDMVCTVSGPVLGPAGTLQPTTAGAVLGLETITAPNNASLGVVEQSDVSLRQLRRNTLALQGISLNEAITSAINALANVLSLKFLENNTGAAATIEGIAMTKNSIWICIDGGSNTDIANAMLQNKSTGSGWNGAVSVPTVDPSTGQSYNVLFDRPVYVPFLIRATVKQGSYVGNLISAVQNAILAFASNTVSANTTEDLDIVGFVVGSDVSPFEIASAIMAQVPGCKVQKVEVTTVAANAYQTTDWVLNINQKATLTTANAIAQLGT